MIHREKSLALSPDIKEVHLTPPSSPSLNKRRQLPVETDSSNVFMRLTNTQSTSTNSKKLSAPGSIAACDRVCFARNLLSVLVGYIKLSNFLSV